MTKYLLLCCLLWLTACAQFRSVEVHQPLSARPLNPPIEPAKSGAIFQSASYQALFEDRRARKVGDTLTININEKISASKKTSTTSDRKGSTAIDIPTIRHFPGKFLQGGNVSAESENKFEGKGNSANDNLFTGTITVTVIEVLPNGNMLVSGEKQIGINQGSEFIRISGVVNPSHILAGNIVSSTQIADARIEYRGTGYLNEAQRMGWLQRFFLSIAPF